MFRYVGLIWDPRDHEADRTARLFGARLRTSTEQWACALATHGLQVFTIGQTSASGAIHLNDHSGVILGTLFTRPRDANDDPSQRVLTIDDSLSYQVHKSSGRVLCDRYWGRYVAFIRKPLDEVALLLRAPVSSLPCYFTAAKNVTVVYSKLTDCAWLTQMRFTIDWQQVAIRLATSLDRVQTSLLKEASTVYPGECVSLAPHRVSRTFYWHPESIANRDILSDLPKAAAAMEFAAADAIAAWGRSYRSIIHLLSGGFDSSVIASFMRRAVAPDGATCLNLRTADHASDERRYARAVASHVGFRLVETYRTENISFSDALNADAHIAPGTPVESLGLNPAIRELAREVGAEVLFTGQHGDSIFCNNPVRFAAIDFARRHGPSRQLIHLLAATRLRSQGTFWGLISDTVTIGLLRKEWDPQRYLVDLNYNPLVLPHARQIALECPATLAPWFSNGSALSPGKLLHALWLFAPTPFYDPLQLNSDPERTEPLLSQPLVEICLRIPTYVHSYKGQRRDAARHAFSAHLPSQITNRYWKSSMGKYLKNILTPNIEFSRQLLMDGVLIKEGILDRCELESAFGISKSTAKFTDILRPLFAEMWISTISSLNAAARGVDYVSSEAAHLLDRYPTEEHASSKAN